MFSPEALAGCTRFDPDIYSDLHKEVYGIRPRGDMSNMTAEMLDAEWDFILRAQEQELEYENECRARARAALEADIERTIALGAGDRDTAVRWLMEAEGADGDYDYFLYKRGL